MLSQPNGACHTAQGRLQAAAALSIVLWNLSLGHSIVFCKHEHVPCGLDHMLLAVTGAHFTVSGTLCMWQVQYALWQLHWGSE